MFTNFNGSVFPENCVGGRFALEMKSRRGMGENEETKSHWCSHVICMEGESDIDDFAGDEALEEHMHGVHLLS